MIDYGAKALKPVENYVVNFMKLWDNLDNPQVVESWHSMNTWVTDNIPLAGGAFRQLIVDLYRNDRLMKGELMIRGQRVDLSRLRANLLTVIAEGDHITHPANRRPCSLQSREPRQGTLPCAPEGTSVLWRGAWRPQAHVGRAHRRVAWQPVELTLF